MSKECLSEGCLSDLMCFHSEAGKFITFTFVGVETWVSFHQWGTHRLFWPGRFFILIRVPACSRERNVQEPALRSANTQLLLKGLPLWTTETLHLNLSQKMIKDTEHVFNHWPLRLSRPHWTLGAFTSQGDFYRPKEGRDHRNREYISANPCPFRCDWCLVPFQSKCIILTAAGRRWSLPFVTLLSVKCHSLHYKSSINLRGRSSVFFSLGREVDLQLQRPADISSFILLYCPPPLTTAKAPIPFPLLGRSGFWLKASPTQPTHTHGMDVHFQRGLIGSDTIYGWLGLICDTTFFF